MPNLALALTVALAVVPVLTPAPAAATRLQPPVPADTLPADSSTVRAAAAPTAALLPGAVAAAVDTARALAPLAPRAATPRALTPAAVRLPVRGPIAGGSGPEVLHVQVLLSAAGFSPGVLDGRWEGGTRAAVRAFREAHDLGPGEAMTEATYRRLVAAAHGRPAVVAYPLAPRDVRGPLRRIPDAYHAKARLDCMCYETVAERLAERFHTTPDVLRRLNPGVDLERAAPGTTIEVPNVWRLPPRTAPARLVVDKGAGALRGYDSTGALLFQFRASVGSDETPSPHGQLRVRSVTRDPWYQYNPRVLTGRAGAPGRVADIPPGPNSPVGPVWIQLSKAHVGIHGTPAPEKVGRAQSHGCVRLTNWDALWLSGLVGPGMTVEFL